MKKKQLLLSAMLVLISTSAANAQKAYTYVQQNGTKIASLGTAAFDLSGSPSVEFDDNGKVVMKIGDNTVAALPMSDNGQLVVEFETTMADADLNKVSKTLTTPFATLYSPFQLTLPASGDVEVYAPTYDGSNHVLVCNSTTKIAASAVIPVEKGLILKNPGTIDLAISGGASTDTHTSALSGSSLQIDKPSVGEGSTLYTLGHETNDNSRFGFFAYTGSLLNPGLAWLVAPTLSSGVKYVSISFGDEATGITKYENVNVNHNGKFLENGRIVIMKNGKKYNINGQEEK